MPMLLPSIASQARSHNDEGQAPTMMDITLFDVVAAPGNLTLRPKALSQSLGRGIIADGSVGTNEGITSHDGPCPFCHQPPHR